MGVAAYKYRCLLWPFNGGNKSQGQIIYCPESMANKYMFNSARTCKEMDYACINKMCHYTGKVYFSRNV